VIISPSGRSAAQSRPAGSGTVADANYGVYLMELLINQMMTRGGLKSRIKAHIYGGANMHTGMTRIGDANARFAINFLAAERIPLIREDTGGHRARRVDFDPLRGRARSRIVEQVAAPSVGQTSMPRAAMSENIHVLTVDDSASMRALLRAALSSRGYNVSQAEDGVAALEWLAQNGGGVDVILTDINMPRMDGFGLIEALRGQSRFRDCPILVLSTESSDDKKARARSAGATGWIVKPFDAEKLDLALRRVTH